MKAKKILFGVFGGLALLSIIASVVLALLVNNVAISTADNKSAFVVFGEFFLITFKALTGKEGAVFTTNVIALMSLSSIVLFVLVGLAWIIIAICKKRFLGILYGFLAILVCAVSSFGLFILAGDVANELFGGTVHANLLEIENGALCGYVCVVAAVLVLITFVLFIIYPSKTKEEKKENIKIVPKPVFNEPLAKNEAKLESKPTELNKLEEPKKADTIEQPKTTEPVEEKKVEQPVKTKPVLKETENVSKPKVEETKKTEEKPAPKKAVESEKPVAKKTSSNTEKKEVYKAYHVSQHPNGGWQVKGAGSEKALKRFKTQAEAIQYAKAVSESQGTTYLVHSMKGKIRKA